MKITVISTGTIETWLHLHARPLVYDQGIRITVPVPCYLLEHNGRKILFDAGQKPLDRIQDPSANYVIRVTPEETAVRQLEKMNISAGEIDYIIISHAHGDHCAGLRDFPQATVIAQPPTAEALKDRGNKFIVADGRYDVFGDGALICIPTPGHAAGHQSLLMKGDDGREILLIGDVVYMPEALDYEPTESEYEKRPEYFDSIRLVRSMRDNGVELCFGHDPYTLV